MNNRARRSSGCQLEPYREPAINTAGTGPWSGRGVGPDEPFFPSGETGSAIFLPFCQSLYTRQGGLCQAKRERSSFCRGVIVPHRVGLYGPPISPRGQEQNHIFYAVGPPTPISVILRHTR